MSERYTKNRNAWRKTYSYATKRIRPKTENFYDGESQTTYTLDLEKVVRHRDYYRIEMHPGELPMSVISIDPISASNEESFTFNSIVGQNFIEGANAFMEKSGESGIESTGIIFQSPTVLVDGVFDTFTASLGYWDLRVANPSGFSDTLPNAILIFQDPLTLDTMSPSTAMNTGSLTFEYIIGTNFRDGANVYLERIGETSITASGVIFQDSTSLVSGVFALSGVATGAWDLRVTNPSGNSVSLETALTVEEPVFTPESLAGLFVWYDAAEAIMAVPGQDFTLVSWPDKGPNNLTLIDPVYTGPGQGYAEVVSSDGRFNNKPVVQFHQAQVTCSFTQWPATGSASEMTVAWVHNQKYNGTSNTRSWTFANAGINTYWIRRTNFVGGLNVGVTDGNAVTDTFGTPTDEVTRTYIGVYQRSPPTASAAEVELWANGQRQAHGAAPDHNWVNAGTMSMGHVYQYQHAAMAEFVMYPRKLTQPERLQLFEYFSVKYGIELSGSG